MLLTTVLFLIIGIILLIIPAFGGYDRIWDYWYTSTIAVFGYIVIGMGLCFFLAIPFGRWITGDFIKQVEATQITLNEQRENDLTEYERATLSKTIVEVNQMIAAKQNRNTVWRSKAWFHPDIANVKYIK